MIVLLRQVVLLVLGIAALHPSAASARSESSTHVLREGQWLEVRGSYREDGRFVAERADLVQPGRYEVLIGTAQPDARDDYFRLLGIPVEIHEKTDFERLDGRDIRGARVKVEGYYRGEDKFSAREIGPRGEGRERITGRIDRIRNRRSGTQLSIMNFLVEIPKDMLVRHDAPPGDFLRTEPTAQMIVDRNRDEEDLFGEGVWITENLMVAGQAQARGAFEENYNLNERDREDRDDLEATLRARFVYQPSGSFFAVAEFNHRELWRDDEDEGRRDDGNSRLGESYFYWIDPFGSGIDLQAGRVDFDDEREWLYDQNLDAVRAIWSGAHLRAELSYSETLSDGSPIDESAANTMLYLSNQDEDRHLAAYLVHRDFDLGPADRRTHFGFRAFGEWLPRQESWLELSWLRGRSGGVNARSRAIDLGTTWKPHRRLAFTAGYARGQGGAPGADTDRTYRQTGLQDNNAKFAGVTSFRYYGELVDPELANLEIVTAGIGWLPASSISLDLVWHSYRQDELSTRLVDTDLDRRPNGRNRDLGEEWDLVFGWRTPWNLDVEAVAAWFEPGPAFNGADDAFLGKLQFRYRF
jgi:alginate production protein